MPEQSVDLRLPLRGWNTVCSVEEQEDGTSRDLLNVLPRNWRDGGSVALSRRPGLSKYVDDQPCGDNPFQAITAANVVAASGVSVIGASVVSDNFVRSDTSAGDLGSFDGGSADYSIAVSALGKTSGTISIEDFSWIAAYASGDAAKVASNKCVDNQNATSSSSVQTSICYFLPDSTTEPTDNYSLKMKFTTKSSFSSTDCMIGLFCKGNFSALGGSPAYDSAFWIGLAINSNRLATVNYGFNTTTSASAKEWRDGAHYKTSTASATANPAKPAYTNSGIYPYDSGKDDTVTLSVSTQYTLEIRVSGKRVELLLNDLSWMIFPDISVGSDNTTTPYISAQNQYGHFFYNVGSGGRSAAASIDLIDVSSITIDSPQATTQIVTVNGGDVCFGNEDAGFETASSGSGVYSAASDVFAFTGLGSSSAAGKTFVYVLDGASYKKVLVTASSASVLTWAASPGTLPQGSTDSARRARFGTVWRNRIVLYGVDVNPDNWYMSRAGSADDWDYTATPDGTQAFAGSSVGAGYLPRAMTCFAGFDDDNAIMGSLSELFVMRGDPALSGVIDGITDRVGIVGPDATAQDDMGRFYFVDRSGLMMIQDGQSKPTRLSHNVVDQFFADIDWDSVSCKLHYSRRYRGLRILLCPHETPDEDGDPIKSLWWDDTGTPWYHELPASRYPSAICKVETGTRSLMLMGGYDGYLRNFDEYADDDDELVVESYADLPPITIDGEHEVGLRQMLVKLGKNTHSASIKLRSSKTADTLGDTLFRHDVHLRGTAYPGGMGRGTPKRVDRAIKGAAVGVRIGGTHGGYFWSVDKIRATLDAGYAFAGGN